ncbi:hypothetical protein METBISCDRAFT_25187 [Metschnikowia bicuspidata]|uniref:Altered inheritance of mitochondria protein 21 n=1 Tax=Metschnikowia bicuspidata TaxID=27322 RepID=A0A4P9ZKK9_9ASCO|nr:hypothetical protein METBISCDRAFT_25187 [Metschnikowia bicuspidata]
MLEEPVSIVPNRPKPKTKLTQVSDTPSPVTDSVVPMAVVPLRPKKSQNKHAESASLLTAFSDTSEDAREDASVEELSALGASVGDTAGTNTSPIDAPDLSAAAHAETEEGVAESENEPAAGAEAVLEEKNVDLTDEEGVHSPVKENEPIASETLIIPPRPVTKKTYVDISRVVETTLPETAEKDEKVRSDTVERETSEVTPIIPPRPARSCKRSLGSVVFSESTERLKTESVVDVPKEVVEQADKTEPNTSQETSVNPEEKDGRQLTESKLEDGLKTAPNIETDGNSEQSQPEATETLGSSAEPQDGSEETGEKKSLEMAQETIAAAVSPPAQSITHQASTEQTATPLVPPRPNKPSLKAAKVPPPKPGKLSSKIAAFQQIFNQPETPKETRRPPLPAKKWSGERSGFACNLEKIMGKGIPLPGMVRPEQVLPKTASSEEQEEKQETKTMPPIARRPKGPRGRKLPKLVQDASIVTEPRFQMKSADLWEIRIEGNEAVGDAGDKKERKQSKQSKQLKQLQQKSAFSVELAKAKPLKMRSSQLRTPNAALLKNRQRQTYQEKSGDIQKKKILHDTEDHTPSEVAKTALPGINDETTQENAVEKSIRQ